MKIPADYQIRGQTFKQWATELFEYEYCDECGEDEDAHDASVVLGNWFAMCREANVTRHEAHSNITAVSTEPLTAEVLRSALKAAENEPLRPDLYEDGPHMRKALGIEEDV